MRKLYLSLIIDIFRSIRVDKLIILVIFFIVFQAAYALAQSEPEQTISDFNLSGFGEEGKTWELSGKSADIHQDEVKLKQITGKLYGKEEDILLTAEQGNFDKQKATVHLQEDVVITTSGGAKLTTDSLDWDRKKQIITTSDPVNIKKDTMVTTAKGAEGQPDLNKISLKKDVTVQIASQDKQSLQTSEQDKTIITCDGPLEIDYQKNLAIFNNNVKVQQKDIVIFSDIMDVYFITSKNDEVKDTEETSSVMDANLNKIICKGNVKIMRGENISYCDQAIYTAIDKKVILTGRPKLIIYSRDELGAGEKD